MKYNWEIYWWYYSLNWEKLNFKYIKVFGIWDVGTNPRKIKFCERNSRKKLLQKDYQKFWVLQSYLKTIHLVCFIFPGNVVGHCMCKEKMDLNWLSLFCLKVPWQLIWKAMGIDTCRRIFHLPCCHLFLIWLDSFLFLKAIEVLCIWLSLWVINFIIVGMVFIYNL